MGFRDKSLDATVQVVTPENIAFEYRVAGPFRRLPALILDVFLQKIVEVGLFIGIFMTLGMVSPGLSVLIICIATLFIDWFYGAFFETFLNGQTPGKYVL